MVSNMAKLMDCSKLFRKGKTHVYCKELQKDHSILSENRFNRSTYKYYFTALVEHETIS